MTRFGIVIPAYRQPQFLVEAVSSAAEQSLARQSATVIVNDGCPLVETHQLGTLLASTYPTVHYVQRENGGPGAARNVGVRFLLERLPELESFFFLDADNYAQPTVLERLARTLDDSGADWAYADLTLFGSSGGVWRFPPGVNLYRQHFENQSDVGSLVHRRIFEAGIWFNENMSAYEDWEFFLRAALDGYRGVNAGLVGLHYRKRQHSRNYTAQARHEEVHDEIKRLHPDRFDAKTLLRLEHRLLPRYAVVDLDTGVASCFTLPTEPPTRRMTLDELGIALAASNYGRDRDGPFVPPILVLTTAAISRLLRELKVMPGLLLRLQAELRQAALVEIAFRRIPESGSLEVVAGAAPEAEVVGLAMSTAAIGAYGGLEKIRPVRTVTIGAPVDPPPESVIDPAKAAEWARLPDPGDQPPEDGAASHSGFGHFQHVAWFDTSLASAGTPSVMVLVPWLGLGGFDLCVTRLFAALAASGAPMDLHLVVTESPRIEIDAANLEPFTSVTILGDLPRDDAATMLERITRTADVVVNAHSLLGFDVLEELRSAADAMHVAYLQVIDFDEVGLPAGYPVRAARELEGRLDLMIVPSRHLRNSLLNLGAPDEKICIAPNAPAFAPSDLGEALRLAEAKASRAATGQGELRLLFAGRLDRQKGVNRLARTAWQLTERGFPYRMTVLGKPVIEAETAEFPDTCELAPPVFSPSEIRRHYEEADVVLLPSRWEGLPLTMLDAMAFGCVTVATDVGAIPEVLVDAENGILVSDAQSDEAIGDQMANVVANLVGGDGSADMRARAVQDAFSLSWDDSAKEVVKDMLSREQVPR